VLNPANLCRAKRDRRAQTQTAVGNDGTTVFPREVALRELEEEHRATV
jgi:hypothetical protein